MRNLEVKKTRLANLRLLRKNYTLEKIAELSGTNATYLSQIQNEVIQKKGKTPRGLSEDYANKIEKGLDLPSGWMDQAHDEADIETATNHAQSRVEVDARDTAYLPIPFPNAPASAGPGEATFSNGRNHPQYFHRDWLQRKNLVPEHLFCVYADGDSMAPGIANDDTLMVNKADREVTDGGIYLIRYGDGLRVKRLFRRVDGGITVHSDNVKYAPQEIPSDLMTYVEIIGRVVWRGGKL